MSAAEIAYIDESFDGTTFCMCALIVPMHTWKECFDFLKQYRSHLKTTYGIFTSKELHATEFVAGRGRISPDKAPVPKGLRVFLFREMLADVIARLPSVALISGCWPKVGYSQNEIHALAFSRIQERLQMRSSRNNRHIVLVIDEGKEIELTKVARRSRVWNPVPSRFGAWSDGASYRNIPNDRIIEDPIFKRSDQSYFLQAADFVSFALLKSEVTATAYVAKHKLQTAFEALEPICVKEASPRERRGLGIVRT